MNESGGDAQQSTITNDIMVKTEAVDGSAEAAGEGKEVRKNEEIATGNKVVTSLAAASESVAALSQSDVTIPPPATTSESTAATAVSSVPTSSTAVIGAGDVLEVIETAEIKAMKAHQKQINKWLHDVKHKIYELETSYLEETNMGNIVKGWELEGRPTGARMRGQIEEKERVFSFSSYAVQQDYYRKLKLHQSMNAASLLKMKQSKHGLPVNSNNKKHVLTADGKMKKKKKRKLEGSFLLKQQQGGDSHMQQHPSG